MTDDQTNVGPEAATPAGRKPRRARGTAFKVAALLLAASGLVAGAACWLRGPRDGDTQTSAREELPPSGAPGLFYGWPKPDFVLVLSAQMHGYLQPCGCSEPQFGSLERRYNFVKMLQDRGWPTVAYDLGDIPQIQGPAKLPNMQGLIKYRYAMESLRRIGTAAVSFGEYEAALPLEEAIDSYALNFDKPAVLAANLIHKGDGENPHFPDDKPAHQGPEWGKSYVGNWQVTKATPKVKVGALGIIGTHDPAAIALLIKAGKLPTAIKLAPSVGSQVTAANPKFAFEGADKAIPAQLAAMDANAKPDFHVLLYQGPVELAKLIAGTFPGKFDVILCLSAEDEPPGLPVVAGTTFIIRLGHKGKNIGVVGVNVTGKAGKPFELRYQLVPVGPQYKTPPAQVAGHPIIELMEKYTKELKAEDYLSKYGKIPHSHQAVVKGMPKFAGQKVEYAGTERCAKCHKAADAVWKNTAHARAYKTLQGATLPSLREFDPECIVCHTVGYRYQSGFANAADTPKLLDVGCESCHGPGRLHSANPNNKALRVLMNPWKAPADETAAQKAKRLLNIESMCRDCHDPENDVNWRELAPKWEKIAHPTPEKERQPADED